MTRSRHGRGWGLLAAGLVLGAGTLVRMAQDEPAGGLAAIAVVFVILGLKAMRTADAEPTAQKRDR